MKAYVDEGRSSQGLIVLPIQVGPIQKDIICQVLDKDLTYNILLGHPWIHEMQVVLSKYHQCLKFPYGRQEINILAESNSPQYCNALKYVQDIFVPHNREASTSFPSNDQSQSGSSSKPLIISANHEGQSSFMSKQSKKKEEFSPSTSSNHESQLNTLSKQFEKKF